MSNEDAETTEPNPVTGWIFGIWIVGYPAQLGVFMTAARKAGSNAVCIRRTMRLRIERSDGTPPYQAKYSGTGPRMPPSEISCSIWPICTAAAI